MKPHRPGDGDDEQGLSHEHVRRFVGLKEMRARGRKDGRDEPRKPQTSGV